ncbi:hypothetical protein [Endozoicomonas sp. SCSIO W0465]|uniref:hypothetical protein n=1 Tax=Endozoicomonas sp. SCSIO W0465 TaxID=2918516 RepID=UPI002075FBE2|nr:hypothetical protein [Endozoicomonas sp. SCSIO W0465]USE34340.1 hypothetical protein MJO57_19555 [Endozoicomonas sp. SCSIO W0465]
MDSLTLPNRPYSSWTEKQYNRATQSLSPVPQRRNSICLGEFSTKRVSANCPSEGDFVNTAIPERTINKHDCLTTNHCPVEKTNIVLEEASVITSQGDSSPLSTQSDIPPGLTQQETSNNLLNITFFNYSMLQGEKPPTNSQSDRYKLEQEELEQEELEQEKKVQQVIEQLRREQNARQQLQKQHDEQRELQRQHNKQRDLQRQRDEQLQLQKQQEKEAMQMLIKQEENEGLEYAACSPSPAPIPIPMLIHTHNQVSLIRHLGIQAKNNNCALASFFMAISNSRLLDTLINGIQDGINRLSTEGKKERAESLSTLLSTCQNFYFDEETHGYIADKGLDNLRKIYNINNGELATPLDLTDIISAMLKHIYDYPEAEGDPSQNTPNLKDSDLSLKHKTSWIDAANGRTILNQSTENAKSPVNINIQQHKVPQDLIKDQENSKTIQNFTERYSEYRRGSELALKFTDRLDNATGKITHQKFEYLDDELNQAKTIEVELEEHFLSGIPFVRSTAAKFINPRGQTMFVDQVLSGFNRDEPYSGKVTTTIARMATTVEELINNSLNDTKNQLHLDDYAFKQLLPDADRYPEILFVTFPNFGTKVRADLEWWKDVAIPTAEGEKSDYEVSALISIESGHYLAWSIEGNVLNYADSMGDSENAETIPLVVKMPLTGAETALRAARNDSENKFDAYCSAVRRVAKLGQSAALVILKKKPRS